MKAFCKHGRPWHADCLGCHDEGLRYQRLEVSAVTIWRFLDGMQKRQAAERVIAAVRAQEIEAQRQLFEGVMK